MKRQTAAAAVLLAACCFAILRRGGDAGNATHQHSGREDATHGDPPSKASSSGRGSAAAAAGSERNQSCAAGQHSQWIVRFCSYQMAAEHEASVAAALDADQPVACVGTGRGSSATAGVCSVTNGDMSNGSLSACSAASCGNQEPHWRFVRRRNKAAAFPTDFLMLSCSDDVAKHVKALLEKEAVVRDIHPDRQMTRAPLWEEQGGLGAKSPQGPPWSDNFQHDDNEGFVRRRPGRLQTRPSEGMQISHEQPLNMTQRRRLLGSKHSVTGALKAEQLWERGFKGTGVKVGVFDTGIRSDHPHVKNIKERSNWTHEPTLEDGLGHGSFVAGVVASGDSECPGFAPDVDLHTFRVFTNDQVSYTSWFLDAFNYAIATGMNIVNLSIGGPDYLDIPFVEKVQEVTSNGIIMVSAIGNDGPLFGTLNNPADQNDVIGIGGIDYDDKMAGFSSRGMSTWELPFGSGRAKPDVVAYGKDVAGSRIEGGCRSLSGTSVASPVVAGAVCLLASTVPEAHRWNLLNPASMKQALVEGAVRIPEPAASMFVQGQGKLDLLASQEILSTYSPRASVVPAILDMTDCPYAWPYCLQPLYAGAMPTIFNATILNGMGLTGKLEAAPVFQATDAGGKLLRLEFQHSVQLWPWSGFLALFIRVSKQGAAFSGVASGEITFTVVSPPRLGERLPRRSRVAMTLVVEIIPTPPREKRVLWDQFHSLRYPPGYLPRDTLEVRTDILDWHGDHPATNYHWMYNALRDKGYFLEILGSPLSCFDAKQYGALLIADPEEEWYPEEVAKVAADVADLGLGLVLFAEWFNVDVQSKMRFFDDNTRSWWTPITGGANVPGLNELLAPFGVALGDMVLEGQLKELAGDSPWYASGANIVRWPAPGWLHSAIFTDKATNGTARPSGLIPGADEDADGFLGMAPHGKGRIAVYGDSGCLDASHQRSPCYGLLTALLDYVITGAEEPSLHSNGTALSAAVGNLDEALPERPPGAGLQPFSNVLNAPLRCHSNTPPEFHSLKGSNWHSQQKRRRKGSGAHLNGIGSHDRSYADTEKRDPVANAVADVKGAAQLIDPAAGNSSSEAFPGVMDAIGANAVRPIVNASADSTTPSPPKPGSQEQPQISRQQPPRQGSASNSASSGSSSGDSSISGETGNLDANSTPGAAGANQGSRSDSGSGSIGNPKVFGGAQMPDVLSVATGVVRNAGRGEWPWWRWLLWLVFATVALTVCQTGRRRRLQRRRGASLGGVSGLGGADARRRAANRAVADRI